MNLMISFVTPNIAAALKIFRWNERISGILFFDGEWSCLKSRHLVLWLLWTLTDQQRFYGTRLVTQKRRYYHPLSVVPEVGCIADFYHKLLIFCWFMLWWFGCNILNSGANEYSTTHTSNSSVGKYYVAIKTK